MAETDLRIIVVKEKTAMDPNFAVGVFSASTLELMNGQRAAPRLAVMVAVVDMVQYGTAFIFDSVKRLVLVANNLAPGADGVVVHEHLEEGQQAQVGVVEHGFLLTGSFGGNTLPPQEVDDGSLAALASIRMKVPVAQSELDEARDILNQHRRIPRNPVATPDVAKNDISWDLSPGAFEYNIYWATDVNVTRETGTKISGITGPPFTHTGLNPGTTYYYVVTALDQIETPTGIVITESVESKEVSATPLP